MNTKIKRIVLYLLTAAIFMNTPVFANSEKNYEYIVPMDNRSVNIDYDAELIVAMHYNAWAGFGGGEPDIPKYGVFDFDGNIIIAYDEYDYINILGKGEYIEAGKGGGVIYFDRKGKKVHLKIDSQDVVKIYNMPYTYIGYILESKDYLKIINHTNGSEIKISKKDILSSEDSFIEVSKITDDFIVVSTKLNTVTLSKDGKLRYKFEKMQLGFNNNGYASYNEKDLWGLIDTYGKTIMNPEYQMITADDNGDIRVRKNNKSGIIDIDGNIIAEIKYDDIYRIKEDVFIVHNYDAGTHRILNLKNSNMFKDFDYDYIDIWDNNTDCLIIMKDEKYGLASLDGKVIVPPEYDSMGYDWTNADVMIKVGKIIKDDGYYYDNMRYGYIDFEGNVKVPLIYSEVYGFSEGLCAAVRWEYKEDGSLDSSSRCDVFVDKNGREVIRLKKNMFVFSSSRFSEGLCPVRTEDNMFGRCVYITQTGKQVIENGGWSNSGGSFKKGIAVTTTATSGAMNHNMETYGVIKYLGNQKDGLIISVTFGSTRYVLNGEPFDQNTMVYNGVAYLPAAYLATKLGLTARWDAVTNTTTLTSTGAKPPANSGTSVVPASNPVTKTIMATFGTTKYFLNGEPFEQDTMVYEGVAYLPAAYLAEKLGLTAKWDAKTNITTLTSIN